jgi:hypothetical protein
MWLFCKEPTLKMYSVSHWLPSAWLGQPEELIRTALEFRKCVFLEGQTHKYPQAVFGMLSSKKA